MVIQDFSSSIVFLDTSPLIYFMEGQSKFQKILSRLFDLNDRGDFLFITTSITLLEVLVKPLKEKHELIAQQYTDVLTKAIGIEILDINTFIAKRAALLRARYGLKTPDAIQLAAAIESNCDFFLTNDIRLKTVTEVKVVTLTEIS